MRQTSTLARLAARLFGRNTDAVQETPAIVNESWRCRFCGGPIVDGFCFVECNGAMRETSASIRPRSYVSSSGHAMPIMATRCGPIRENKTRGNMKPFGRRGSNPLPPLGRKPAPPPNPQAIREPCIICKYDHLGDCCLERGHDGPHLFKCAGDYCPGLPWIASNTPHPTSCTMPPGDE